MTIKIRDILKEDFSSIIRLNDAHVNQTSPMDLERLRLLVGLSSYARVAITERRIAAFILAMREGAGYANDNYNWFASRFGNFLYVDRIVVGASFSGKNIGSTLYRNMFEYARLSGCRVITCEYNIDPPNPASRAFHDKLGFKELGTQWSANGEKQVSLQSMEI